jgi:hypothetical protein
MRANERNPRCGGQAAAASMPSRNVGGELKDLASRFNRYRARYLRGEFNEPPGEITDTHWRKYVPE